MIWPFNRLRTYIAGTPVHANDMNAMQDATIRGMHGEIQNPVPLDLAHPGAGWTYAYHSWTGGGLITIPLAFPAATDIRQITVWWNLNGHPFDPATPTDRLSLVVNSRHPFTDTGSLEAESDYIFDSTVGDHDGERIRYTWNLRQDPIHLRPGHFYILGIWNGLAARTIQGVTATTARR